MRKIVVLSLGFLVAIVSFGKDYYESLTKTVEYSGEKSLTADIQLRNGHLDISRLKDDKLVKATLRWIKPEDQVVFAYNKIGNRGKLLLSQESQYDESNIKLKVNEEELDLSGLDKHSEDNEWNLQFSDVVPIEFNLELGACQGDIDLTGLDVEKFNLDCGVSDVKVRCDVPNTNRIKRLKIANGVGKFRGQNLGNLRFRQMKLACGLGSSSVDLRGSLQDGANIDISVGLGSVTILIPKNVGVKLEVDRSFLSSFSYDELEKVGKDLYISDNYDDSEIRIAMSISVGLGSVNIEWVK